MRRILNLFAIVFAAALVLGASGCESDYSYSSPTPEATVATANEAVPEEEPTPVEEPQPDCVIKGNISYNTGEQIYHVPGQQYYDATEIDESAGEMWFCTEQDAINAGWRKSKL